MFEEIPWLLQKEPLVWAWAVTLHERFQAAATYRSGSWRPSSGTTRYTRIRLLRRHNDERVGRAAFEFGDEAQGDWQDALQRALQEAAEDHRLAYEMPSVSPFPEIALGEEIDPPASVEALVQRCQQAVAAEGIRLLYGQVIAAREHVELKNSSDAWGGYDHGQLHVTLRLALPEGQQTFDLSAQRRRADDLPIETMVQGAARWLRDREAAVALPQTPVRLFLGGPLVREVALGLRTPLSAQAVLAGWPHAIPGEAFVPGAKDEGMTVASNGVLPYGTASAPFDPEGLPQWRTVLVERNRVIRLAADSGDAVALGISPTGSFANVELSLGKVPQDQLQAEAQLHLCVGRVQWKPEEGRFVLRFPLGYLRQGHRWDPVSGGEIQGSFAALWSGACPSAERLFLGDYEGPSGLLTAPFSVTA
ncbi:MAG: hypothetical protein IMW91_05095 [Firmicutes bacterium]|nr:hypothetical protein [Bacillota bacterium]